MKRMTRPACLYFAQINKFEGFPWNQRLLASNVKKPSLADHNVSDTMGFLFNQNPTDSCNDFPVFVIKKKADNAVIFVKIMNVLSDMIQAAEAHGVGVGKRNWCKSVLFATKAPGKMKDFFPLTGIPNK